MVILFLELLNCHTTIEKMLQVLQYFIRAVILRSFRRFLYWFSEGRYARRVLFTSLKLKHPFNLKNNYKFRTAEQILKSNGRNF